MRMIKIGNRSLIMRFNTEQINMMNKEGITVKTMSEALNDRFDTSLFNKAFYYSLKAGQKNMTESEAYELLDLWIEEGKKGEEFQLEVLEELMQAQGFLEEFKQIMKRAKEEREKKQNQ